MAVITEVVAVRAGEHTVVTADSDWRVTALSVRDPDLSVSIADGFNRVERLLRAPEYDLNTNILLARGSRLIFHNMARDVFEWRYALFTAETL